LQEEFHSWGKNYVFLENFFCTIFKKNKSCKNFFFLELVEKILTPRKKNIVIRIKFLLQELH